MKQLILILAVVLTTVSCQKDKTKTTLAEPTPLTVDETKALLHGSWSCDSVTTFQATVRVSSTYSMEYRTFNNGTSTTGYQGQAFSYTFLNATTIYVDSWEDLVYGHNYAMQNQLIIQEISTNKLVIMCVHYINYGVIYNYDIHYFRR